MSDFELFSKYFYINPEGVLCWKVKRRKVDRGQPAGIDRGDGYIRVIFNYKPYYAHRIVWLLVHGEWPTEIIDHINRNRNDNRIENLRDTNRVVNGLNRGPALAYGSD